MGIFDTADENGDGLLSLAEAQAGLSDLTAAQFDAMDENKDGQLSEAELSAQTGGAEVGGCVFSLTNGQDLRSKVVDIFLLILSMLTLSMMHGVGRRPVT